MKRLWIALVCCAPTLALAQVWRELGPAPITNGSYTGRISSIAPSRSNPNLMYVAGADGGLWRTTNGGVNWTPLTDGLPSSAMGAVALDPLNESVLYLGSGESNHANHSRYGLGLFKSTDAGGSWTQLAESTFAGRCFSKIIVDPINTSVVYAAITQAGGFPEKAAAKGHPLRDGPLGVFKSTDGGITWTQLLSGLPNQAASDMVMSPTDPGTLYSAVGRIFGNAANGVYKTTNGGASWSKLAGGLPTSNVGRIALAIAPSNASRLYALVTNAASSSGGNATTLGAYRTDNAGATWTALSVGNIQATYGWYLCTASVQPTNPDVVIFGGLSLVRSSNAGGSFSTITPPHVDMHATEWTSDGRLLSGNDGGVHVSSNLGGSWTSLNTGLGVIQFYAGLSTHPSDLNILLGGTQDNGTVRRNTNTKNWSNVLGGDGGWTQIDQANPLRMFAEYQGTATLFRSTNGGSSFSGSSSGINSGDRNCFLPPYEIDPTNSNRMLYCTHRVYESMNGGTSWTAVSGDLSNGAGAIQSIAIAPSNPQVAYVATNDGNVSVSTDGARTFTRVLSGIPSWPRTTRSIFVHPGDDQTAYLAVAQYGVNKIRRTRDRGQTWEPLDGDFPDVPANTIAVDTRGAVPRIYVGADDGVYRSLDDGRAWRRFGVGLPRCAVIDLRLDIGRNRLVVATQGRGAWEASLTRQVDVGPMPIRR